MTERRSRRNPRLRLACSRCQRRKIRCDALFPTCTNCKKASVECADGESLRLRHIPRENVADPNGSRRVAWLESIIRERLPDVDLAPGPPGEPSGSLTPLDIPAEGAVDSESKDLSGLPDHRSCHEIGLVSVGTNSDQRYVGPSSGYFLARILLSQSPRRYVERSEDRFGTISQSIVNGLVEAVSGPLPLPEKVHAVLLCRTYFDFIHPQYPILHEPSFMQSLDWLYETSIDRLKADPYASFQLFMVLAIASTVLSRQAQHHIPGESYCLSALQYFEDINVENSLPGLQCLLLLLIFTLHSPCMKLNMWYLNYQCIAALLDLGLQRDITTSSGISLLNQEMRTRIFWVVITLDRAIATIMGRPIGLRDEACELRLPQPLEDHELIGMSQLDGAAGSIAFSIHLFKITRLNSEIKYVANSIVRDVPSYAYPPVADIEIWKKSMWEKLDAWAASIPQSGGHPYTRIICELRYHNLKMLLLRPSPAIPRPTMDSLSACYQSACKSIHLFDRLYQQDILVHSWMTFHGIVLSIITALYCVRAVPSIAHCSNPDILMEDLCISLGLISATGEHWSSAKRCRDIVNDLGMATIRWMKDRAPRSSEPSMRPGTSERAAVGQNADCSTDAVTAISAEILPEPLDFTLCPNLDDSFWPGSIDFDFDDANMDHVMRNLFEGFIPQTDVFGDSDVLGC
ncbi:hypothetical protein BS50DRAFT_634085 [Corynespora cassiicola Philippines]|uniref:Zn(2)-C6 fungal-type domain-containing protein n=1 Tax=Corynespora cassiicola Philippines TaxID=1448308 RepID=A0A2T2NMB7_CORCC|nr:hypothetical protein BS50DRAFT_634085 [Corynespora cassiicola Philippines]